MRTTVLLALSCVLPAEHAFQAPSANAAKHPLPHVLLMGDSISIHYTADVVRLLSEIASVRRPTSEANDEVNCGSTAEGLRHLQRWVGSQYWDVIHFNWGLHDLCYRHPESTVYGKRDKVRGAISVPLDAYERNLESLVLKMKQSARVLVWASTTVVPPGEAGRFEGDEVKYNAVAERIMRKHNVRINDLHALTSAMPQHLFVAPGDVHFRPPASRIIAGQVAAEIVKALHFNASSRRAP